MEIKNGDFVSLDYEGRLESGEVFDSSSHGDHSHPLEFKVGTGQVITGFESAVVGMKKGEEKEFTINPEEAYGMPDPKMVQKVPRSSLPKGQEPREGMMLVLGSPEGHQFPAKIKTVTDNEVEIDLNHPLAGEKLIFKIKILDINGKPSEGHNHH